MSDITRILERVEQGDHTAATDLMPLVCEEVRRLGIQHQGREILSPPTGTEGWPAKRQMNETAFGR
jgi:hypothetical protein